LYDRNRIKIHKHKRKAFLFLIRKRLIQTIIITLENTMIFNLRFLVDLLQHIAIFFTLIYFFKYIIFLKYKIPLKLEYILNGVLFAVIASIGMFMRIKLGEGHYIDGRIILVGISAAYVHPVAGIITAILVSSIRLYIGGVGVSIGVIGICGGAIVGILYYSRNKLYPKTYTIPSLLLFGLLLTLQAQIWIPILFPWNIASMLIREASLIGFITYPVGTLIIGLILNGLVKQKQSEIKLSESEARWRSLTETSPDHILILDNNLNIQLANFSASGLAVEELIGTPLYQYLEGDEKQAEVKTILESVLKTGEQTSYETVNTIPDGGTIYFESRVVPRILESSKNIIGLTVSSRDITERKRVVEKLKESEEKYRILFETMPLGITVSDEAGNIIESNPVSEKLLGISKTEHEQRSIDGEEWKIIRPDGSLMPDDEYTSVRALKENRIVDNVEMGIAKTKEKVTWINVTAAPIPLTGYGVLVAYSDICEKKQSEEKIKASLKEKEILLQEIHHRVKNNMQVINSLLKLQSNNIENEQTKEILKDSQSRIFAMSAVHETLHGSEKLSEIDLKSYLSKITTSVFQTYCTDHRKVKLNSNVDNSPISINQAYPLGLIINELMSNSLKYAFSDEREGEITVNMKKLDKELELSIKDDGVGMPDDFDWKNTNSLGLKLVRTLVENQLDGSIGINSNNGTKFTIKFNIET
jgi:PAS domain S-box-containing protein